MCVEGTCTQLGLLYIYCLNCCHIARRFAWLWLILGELQRERQRDGFVYLFNLNHQSPKQEWRLTLYSYTCITARRGVGKLLHQGSLRSPFRAKDKLITSTKVEPEVGRTSAVQYSAEAAGLKLTGRQIGRWECAVVVCF